MGSPQTFDAVLVAPEVIGRVTAAGASALVEDVVLEVLEDAESITLERLLEANGGGCRGSAAGLDDALTDRVGKELRARLTEEVGRYPELAGWSVQVALVEEEAAGDAGEAVEAVEAVEAIADGDTPVLGLSRSEETEPTSEDGKAGEGRLFEEASRLRGVPLGWLSTSDLEASDPDDRGQALRRARLVAGCLMRAADVVVDELFEDVETLSRANEDDEVVDLESTFVLSGLPSRFAHHYTPLFARKFLVAMIDVTRRLTAGWQPLSCVAEELATRILLDQVDVQADIAGVDLGGGWRGHLEDLVFDDVDHELLYDPALNGIEDQPALGPPGMAPMGYEWWFVAFNADRPLPPYIQDDRPEATATT